MSAEQVIETFIKAMNHYENFHQKSSEKTWLTRIAINCCKNMMRMNWFRLGVDIWKKTYRYLLLI